jgi:uncharacterized protein YjbI with pentapeptide repeats
MKGEEFIKKILAGERDFSGIKLEEGFDLSGHESYAELQGYLRKAQESFKESPIILDNSELRHIKANELYLPFVRGREANLKEADLREAYLEGANLKKANLKGAKNLETALHVEDAIFNKTRVTEREKAIIEEALKRRQLFVVE